MSTSRRWTPAGAVSRSQRSIAAAVADLRKVAYEWADVDEGIVFETEEWIKQLERWSGEIKTSIDDRLNAGEHVGL